MGGHLSHTAEQFAAEFMAGFRNSGAYLREPVARLAEAAIGGGEPARLATDAIFKIIVEPLADSFDVPAAQAYNRFFAQVIDHCRRSEQGRPLDRELTKFNLHTEVDLLTRAQRLRRTPTVSPESRAAVRRIIILSRVTLGADVAITSSAIQRAEHEFPNAEVVLLGGRKMAELFGGDARITFRDVPYQRAGTLIDRLLAWLNVLDICHDLTAGLEPGECLIIDPDSRLTQLGLLPLLPPEQEGEIGSRYLFFPSREYQANSSKALGRLTSDWLNEVFGGEGVTLPRVSLSLSDMEAAGGVAGLLKRAGKRPVVSINFGAGGNSAKRVGDWFERELVKRLMADGAAVILDKGAGEDEAGRADAIISYVANLEVGGRSARVLTIDEQNLQEVSCDGTAAADLAVWNGRIGMLAALIRESDLYIGYDSAGQHIAAALGVRCIDLFAGFTSRRMLDRWRPTGPGETHVIALDTLNETPDEKAALADTFRLANERIKRGDV